MRDGKRQELPVSLVRLERRFAAWRKTRSAGTRIPESLWKAAEKVATEIGVSRTSNALKVNYYALKKRVAQTASKPSDSPDFIELLPPSPAISECTIELENNIGSMRVHLKGQGVDLLALSRGFWDAD